ncbi:MAG: hypothetical protein DRJ09_05580 [Bacteroidetes bacterium]|nr:MAG: hypothetical protein DRJ09_05580 [Bacteroidota bacterium]
MIKKVIKFTALIAFIVALGFSFMANSHKTETNKKSENPPPCWIQPTVTLSGECVKYNENADYVVNMKITDICSNPNVVLYDSTKSFLSDQSSTTFCVPNQLCTVDQVAKCFVVTITAIKKDNTTNTIICSGQRQDGPFTCEELMTYTRTIVQLY